MITLRGLLQTDPINDPHSGMLLDYGLQGHDTGQRAELLKRVVAAAKASKNSPLYRQAFDNWKNYANPRCEKGEVALKDRMHIGLGNSSVIETNVTLHSVYGLPMIPGEALKGALRAFAYSRIGPKDEERYKRWDPDFQTLFGKIDQAGAIVVHDAWWDPNSREDPLCLEVETPHHREYYSSGGKTPATDYDDPNPISQLAVQGSFFVAIEKEPLGDAWAKFAFDLLREALATEGIGGRVNAGYGRFAR